MPNTLLGSDTTICLATSSDGVFTIAFDGTDMFSKGLLASLPSPIALIESGTISALALQTLAHGDLAHFFSNCDQLGLTWIVQLPTRALQVKPHRPELFSIPAPLFES